MSDWNTRIIEEFRANGGKVGGTFEGRPLLLLHTVGAKTGKVRVAPLMYQTVEDGYAIFGSKAGADSHPDWYYNLLADPSVSVEVGTEKFDLVARVAEGAEREQIWTKQKSDYPFFAEYEAGTDREIPVIVLERR